MKRSVILFTAALVPLCTLACNLLATPDPSAAYPYEWWFDGRTGDPQDEWSVGNNVPSVNDWLLLGADAMAYAYRLSGDADYLERATTLFRTGSHDPWFEEDANTYSSTKETVNGITFGHVFLHVWAEQGIKFPIASPPSL